MATSREQRTSASVLAGIPAELAVPWTNAVIIIHFAVVKIAEQALINDSFGGEKLAGVPALEADAGVHSASLDRIVNRAAVSPIQSQRFFDDHVFARVGGGDGVARMVVRVTANRDSMERLVGEKRVQIRRGGDLSAVARAQCCRI